MPILIDAHQDLAYNIISFGRDYRRSALETRQIEVESITHEANGQCLLGYPEYIRGRVALVFATLFVMPRRFRGGAWEKVDYATLAEANRLEKQQLDVYLRLCGENPDKFQLIRNKREFSSHWTAWENSSEGTLLPVGLVLSIEGAEGVADKNELAEWFDAGVRFIGPVWAGTRYCGGMYEPGKFTAEGLRFLEDMADLGYTLDIAHMTEESALQALDRYERPIIASHANAAALIEGDSTRRHLSDRVLLGLAERGGVVGTVPFNRFLLAGWKNDDPRWQVKLSRLVDHIDHICQVTGSAHYAAIGTDFDGGFGWPAIPEELDTIADLQLLDKLLSERGYTPDQIDAIFSGNWRRILEQTLPA